MTWNNVSLDEFPIFVTPDNPLVQCSIVLLTLSKNSCYINKKKRKRKKEGIKIYWNLINI